MSAAVARKKKRLSEDKVEFRAEKAWMDRLDRVAARLGLTRSAYMRLRLTEAMDRDERPEPQKRK